MRICVTGAGGFIGGHLVKHLEARGHDVTGVDIKPLDEWEMQGEENLRLDLRYWDNCKTAVAGCRWVFNLAADMGGMGYITTHHADCMMSVLITAHMIKASVESGITKFLGASSACVYPEHLQDRLSQPALRESDAYPAKPEPGYGEEKLFGERLAQVFQQDYGISVRIPRFHNVYGPHTAYKGGREKAPAAICRKISTAKHTGEKVIEIWGDGKQERSFMYIDDALTGMMKLMHSEWTEPLNVGSSEMVTVNQLVDIVSDIAGIEVEKRYDLLKPQGVRGRNSDNTLIQEVLNWEPSTPLRVGLEKTYAWVDAQVRRDLQVG